MTFPVEISRNSRIPIDIPCALPILFVLQAFAALGDSPQRIKWSDGPFDHPAELNQAVSFCNKNGIRQLWVTTRTQQGIRKMGDVELIFIPTASFAYQLDKTGVFK